MRPTDFCHPVTHRNFLHPRFRVPAMSLRRIAPPCACGDRAVHAADTRPSFDDRALRSASAHSCSAASGVFTRAARSRDERTNEPLTPLSRSHRVTRAIAGRRTSCGAEDQCAAPVVKTSVAGIEPRCLPSGSTRGLSHRPAPLAGRGTDAGDRPFRMPRPAAERSSRVSIDPRGFAARVRSEAAVSPVAPLHLHAVCTRWASPRPRGSRTPKMASGGVAFRKGRSSTSDFCNRKRRAGTPASRRSSPARGRFPCPRCHERGADFKRRRRFPAVPWIRVDRPFGG